ncbi:MAG: Flp pilus assembly complex ATPase component TadA [Deltaproteobacteria bacterium]|nr:Flp pilus assembly complex ATPase component TadA [Deltaproteobacteria bacterium]
MKELAVSSHAQRALIKLLVKNGLLEPKDIEQFPDNDSCPISYFARRGRFNESEAIKAVAKALGIPITTVDKHNLARIVHTLEHPLFAKFAASRWRELRAVPVDMGDAYVVVAMANPLDHDAKSALEFDLGREVRISIAQEDQIQALLADKMNASALFDLDSLMGEKKNEEDQKITDIQKQESSIFQGDASSAPIVRLVNKIFSDAVQHGASDIHLTPDKDKVAVRIRVDGIIQHLFDIPQQAHAAVLTRIKLLCGMDIAERRKPQDGRLRIKTALGAKDLRVSVLPTVHGENVVARILSSDLTLSSFSSLGVPADVEKHLLRNLSGSSKVILVTGPTGSGKTSTLYAGLLHLHDGKNNIITIEDPIEYRIQGVNQIQVNPKIGMTFAETLRSVLRQDPDVVMVGEIRDKETASTAMQVAQTGHLVLSTLHTNSAPAAITRLRDLGIPSYLIASSVGSVVAQRLVRRLCDCCVPAEGPVLERCKELGLPTDQVKQAKGCDQCAHSGFKGRVGIFSFLDFSEPIIEAIRQDASEAEIARLARESGYRTLEESGLAFVQQGVTSIDELERTLGVIDLESMKRNGAAIVSRAHVSGPVEPQRSSGPLGKRKILLVEDEENTRTVLSMLFQREHFEVIEATNGVEGLDCVYQYGPELIVCDLMMPKMNGLEMVQKLKNDSRTREIPVIVLTAADDEKNELSLIGGGADDFVSKTTDSKIMMARVHRLLGRAG